MTMTTMRAFGVGLWVAIAIASCSDDGVPEESTDRSASEPMSADSSPGTPRDGATAMPDSRSPGLAEAGPSSRGNFPDSAVGAMARDAGGDAQMRDAASATASDASSADAASPATPADAGSATGPSNPAACPQGALRAGDTPSSLMHGGMMRTFIVHVPTGYDNTRPLPLVLNFHGATMTAALQQQTTGMNGKADQAGFVVVYPDGFDRSWNAGACCGGAVSSKVDDVGFARAIVAYMRERVCIDPKRVYATGFSNGGRMSYRLGCEAADLFAAIAPVAGTKSFPDLENSPGCTPQRPIPLLDIMGADDSRIAAQPGQVAEWRKFNGCTDAQPTETYRTGQHACYSYQQCTAGTSVTYCVVSGLGHSWPRSGFSANDRIWAMFERISL